MDGENSGYPIKMDDLGGKHPIFGNTHIVIDLNANFFPIAS